MQNLADLAPRARAERPTATRWPLIAIALLVPLACSSKDEPKPAVTNGGAATATATTATPGATSSTVSRSASSATTAASRTAPSVSRDASAGTVVIKGYEFLPSSLDIGPGTTITWSNQESDPPTEHWIETEPNQPSEIDSGRLAPGATFSYVPSQPGTYAYYCEIHNFMKGKVVVTP